MKEWPQLVGKPGAEAKEVINQEDPNLNVEIMEPGDMATRDYRLDRVRIYVD